MELRSEVKDGRTNGGGEREAEKVMIRFS